MGASPNQSLVKMQNNGNSHTNWFPVKLNLDLLYGPATPLLGIYPREMKTYIYNKGFDRKVYSSFIHNSPKPEQPQCPSVGEWITKPRLCIYPEGPNLSPLLDLEAYARRRGREGRAANCSSH